MFSLVCTTRYKQETVGMYSIILFIFIEKRVLPVSYKFGLNQGWLVTSTDLSILRSYLALLLKRGCLPSQYMLWRRDFYPRVKRRTRISFCTLRSFTECFFWAGATKIRYFISNPFPPCSGGTIPELPQYKKLSFCRIWMTAIISIFDCTAALYSTLYLYYTIGSGV